MRTWLSVIVCVVLLAAGAGLTALIFATEPTAERVGATRRSAMLVEVTAVSRGSFRPTIATTGVVEPERDVRLAPRVGGEIVERSPLFTPGGVVPAGEVLVRIDPADFENVLAQRRSDLRRAQADLELEQGRREVAALDFELLESELAPRNRALVLREPQLETARAAVDAARAAVAQAELDLERTAVVAPFDALVLTRTVDVGSQVNAGEPLGRLIGLDAYWVVASVPLGLLQRLDAPGGPEQLGAPARVFHRTAWPAGTFRTGRVSRAVGALDEGSRLAEVLITVDDPLARGGPEAEGPPLVLGSYLGVEIVAREVTDVVRLPRELLRRGDTVWVFDDGVLRVRPVTIELRDADHVYVLEGLEEGDRVVTTNLASVVDGAPLTLATEAQAELR